MNIAMPIDGEPVYVRNGSPVQIGRISKIEAIAERPVVGERWDQDRQSVVPIRQSSARLMYQVDGLAENLFDAVNGLPLPD